MRSLSITFAAAAVALATFVLTPVADAATDAKCDPDTLSAKLHERMKSDGKTDAEIRDILSSSMKRRIMTGRIADGSGCTAEQTEKALEKLETTIKHG
jgi:molybdopterin biosynthesis enzyme